MGGLLGGAAAGQAGRKTFLIRAHRGAGAGGGFFLVRRQSPPVAPLDDAGVAQVARKRGEFVRKCARRALQFAKRDFLWMLAYDLGDYLVPTVGVGGFSAFSFKVRGGAMSAWVGGASSAARRA